MLVRRDSCRLPERAPLSVHVVATCLASAWVTRRFDYLWGFKEPFVFPTALVLSVCISIALHVLLTFAASLVITMKQAYSNEAPATKQSEQRMPLYSSFVRFALALVFLLIWLDFMVAIRHGTFVACRDAQRLEAYLLTVPRNHGRMSATLVELTPLVDSGIDLHVHVGLDARDYNTSGALLAAFGTDNASEYHPALSSRIAVTLNMRNVLLRADAETSSATGWILLVEDDARMVQPVDFLHHVACAYAGDVPSDVVWLDTRNAAAWWGLGRVSGGMTATLFRRSALRVVADVWRFDGPLSKEARRRFPPTLHNWRGVGNDDILADVCNSGALRCAAAPFAKESGQESTNRASIRLNWT